MANSIGGASPHDITATKAYVDRKTGAKADKLRFHEAKGSNVPGMNVVVVEPQTGAANHANISLVSDASIVLSYDGPTSAEQRGGSAAEFELPAVGEASGSFVFNDMVSIGTDVTFSADVDVSRRVDGSIAMSYVRIYITVSGNRHLVHEGDFFGELVSNDFYYGDELTPSFSTFDGIFVSSIFFSVLDAGVIGDLPVFTLEPTIFNIGTVTVDVSNSAKLTWNPDSANGACWVLTSKTLEPLVLRNPHVGSWGVILPPSGSTQLEIYDPKANSESLKISGPTDLSLMVGFENIVAPYACRVEATRPAPKALNIYLQGSSSDGPRNFSLLVNNDASAEQDVNWITGSGDEFIEKFPGAMKLAPVRTVWDVKEVAPNVYLVDRTPGASGISIAGDDGNTYTLGVDENGILEVKGAE